MITPVLLFELVMGVIGSFQVFDSIYLMIGDSPGGESKTFNFYIWEQGFRYSNMGYASALAWVLFVVIMIFSVIQFRVLRGHTEY